MGKGTLALIIFLSVLAVVLGWNYVTKPFAALPQLINSTLPSPSPQSEVAPTANQQVVNILSQLTPEQRVRQLLAVPATVTTASSGATISPAWRAWIRANQPGAVTLFGSNISSEAARKVIQELQVEVSSASQSAKVGLLVAVDHEGGDTQRLSGVGFTRLPAWQDWCDLPATQSGELLSRSSQELQQVGVNVVFAPVADLGSNHPVLKKRVCSNQPTQVVTANRQAIKTYQQQNILPVLKHFPGLGPTTKDLHRSFDTVFVSPEQAGVFKQILDVHPRIGVMVAHVGVQNQYPDVPCSLSTACVQELAQSYPSALIFSDAVEMVAARHVTTGPTKPLDQVVQEAIQAGNDVVVFGPISDPAVMEVIAQKLTAEYRENPSFKVRVDASVGKVIQYKLRYVQP